MEADSPKILHQEGIIQNFLADLETLPSIRSFHLCHLHEEHKKPLIRRISIEALQDVLLAVNQSYKEKKKEEKAKRNTKARRVQHL